MLERYNIGGITWGVYIRCTKSSGSLKYLGKISIFKKNVYKKAFSIYITDSTHHTE